MSVPSTKEKLIIRVTGAGVSPENIRASDLGELITLFEKAILETIIATEQVPHELLEQNVMVSLVAINYGSEALTFALTGEVFPAASTISHAIAQEDYSAIPAKAQQALHEISNQATNRTWAVEFPRDEVRDIQEAVISEVTPVPPPESPYNPWRYNCLWATDTGRRRSATCNVDDTRWKLSVY
jgi:hypothetical protein